MAPLVNLSVFLMSRFFLWFRLFKVICILFLAVGFFILFSYSVYDIMFGKTSKENYMHYLQLQDFCEPYRDSAIGSIPVRCKQYFNL
jgi:predicted membrane protein